MFLLGCISTLAYLAVTGIVADRLCWAEINGRMSGGEFLFVVMLWPVGLLWMAAKKVWR